MKKLYEIEITISGLVVADSEKQALKFADDILYAADINDASVRQWTQRSGYPTDWTQDCIPYGESGDKTIGEWLAEIEAENESKRPDPDQMKLTDVEEVKK